MNISKTALAALLLSTSLGWAQQASVYDLDAVEDQVEDIEKDVRQSFDDSARPLVTSGDARLGWRGSLSGSLSAADGNSDVVDIAIGARLGFGTERWNHDFNLVYDYSEGSKRGTTGSTDENKLLAAYDISHYYADRAYVFGNLRYAFDDIGPYEHDLVLGVGPGYHVVDTDTTAWRLQAGPAYRRLVDQTGHTEDELGATIGSKFWQRLSDNAVLTNDTDIVWSESDTLIANDFGVNFSLSKSLTMRTSLRTEYHTDPLPGYDDTDNTIGASVIYSFN